MLKKRRRILVGMVVGALAISGAGVGAAALVRSPAQAAAEAEPPEPDLLTATVERRILKNSVVTRGTVISAQSLDITPAVDDGSKPIITEIGAVSGETFKAGEVLVEVAGRPVFSLRGSLPAYRDLKPGAQGNDVEQLQSALGALGYPVGEDRVGRYGSGTKAAVTDLYASLGYQPRPAPSGAGGSVESAKARVRAAQQALTALRAETGNVPTAEISDGREELAAAREELAAVEETTGPMVPASEVVFLPSFPARVDALSARVGQEVNEKFMTVSAGRLVVRGSLAPHERDLVRPGMKARVLSEVTGDSATGTVESVSRLPATESDPEQGYSVLVQPDEKLPPDMVGQDVRLSIEAASSEDEVLVVPLSAVSAGADARTTVTVVDDRGRRRRVEVRPGMTGDGYVEVTPVEGRLLRKGDSVIVGVSADTASTSDAESARPGGTR